MKENNKPRPTPPFGVGIDWRIDGTLMAHAGSPFGAPGHGGVAAPPAVMTPEEVAAFLDYPLSTVWALLRRGEIPSAFLGRRRRVLREDLLAAFRGKSDATKAAARVEPLVLPDRVEPVGRIGRPRKIRRRYGAPPDSPTDPSSTQAA